MENFAIIETGGKQYRVKVGDSLWIEKIEAQPGEDVELTSVLSVARDGKLSVGKPNVENAKVVATVEKTEKTDKQIVFKYRPKTRYRRKLGHRQQMTQIVVKDIVGV